METGAAPLENGSGSYDKRSQSGNGGSMEPVMGGCLDVAARVSVKRDAGV